jgi:2-methylcitrate dehydratase PrpD
MSETIIWNGPAQPASDPTGPTGRLCEWLQNLRLQDVPAQTRERAKDILLDGIGCAIVGAHLPWSRIAVDAVTRFEGRGDRTLIGWGRTLPATTAALLNGTFIQGFELDDFHPRAPLHSAALVIPALLACAEERGGVTGAQFLLAAVAGFEVGPRVGLALHGPEMLSRGWHSGAVFGTHTAAAAAGILLKLDAARFEDAFGLAGTQSAGLMAAQYEAMCKRMHHGFSARNGLFAALVAAGGYTGIKRVFERPYGGFLSMFGEGHAPRPHEICADLGSRWETQNIVLKPYAAMGGVHASLDGIFALMAEKPIRADSVLSIDIELSHALYHHGWWKLERPVTPIAAQMNVAYAVAAAILDGEAMVAQFAPGRIDRDDIWALIPRITAHHNPEFDKGGEATRYNMRMAVQLTDGTRREHFTATTKTISQPLSRAGTLAKFNTLTRDLIDSERRDRIVECVLGIETLSDTTTLSELLAARVEAAF